MKTWKEIKLAFLGDHLSKTPTSPDRKLRSLNYIEDAITREYPGLLEADGLFTKMSESDFKEMYRSLKGSGHLNRYDISVIHGLYKFSK